MSVDPGVIFIVLQFCLLVGGYVAYVTWHRRRVDRQEDRFQRGLCLSCGYDLRGATGGRCPECGTPFNPRLDARRETP